MVIIPWSYLLRVRNTDPDDEGDYPRAPRIHGPRTYPSLCPFIFLRF
jgi:hypothetical protein